MTPAAALVSLTLAWNPVPDATGYRVWRGIEPVAVVNRAEAAIHIPTNAPAVLTVTAINAAGESAHSAPLHLQIIEPPQTLTIQGSPDLTEWHDIPRPGDTFFRIKIER